MNEAKPEQDRSETTPAVELSTEEWRLLERIQTGSLTSRLRRWAKNPPLFFWWMIPGW